MKSELRHGIVYRTGYIVQDGGVSHVENEGKSRWVEDDGTMKNDYGIGHENRS